MLTKETLANKVFYNIQPIFYNVFPLFWNWNKFVWSLCSVGGEAGELILLESKFAASLTGDIGPDRDRRGKTHELNFKFQKWFLFLLFAFFFFFNPSDPSDTHLQEVLGGRQKDLQKKSALLYACTLYNVLESF